MSFDSDYIMDGIKENNDNSVNDLLVITVMPDRKIIPEWISSDSAIPESIAEIQHRIYKRFSTDPEKWLFYLGFHEPNGEFSLSIRYFISVSELFVRELSRVPDLESQRDKVKIRIPEVELNEIVNRAPMMTGS